MLHLLCHAMQCHHSSKAKGTANTDVCKFLHITILRLFFCLRFLLFASLSIPRELICLVVRFCGLGMHICGRFFFVR